jgi:LAO/AO transport system kinase
MTGCRRSGSRSSRTVTRSLATGERQERRQRQQIGWMWSLIGDRLIDEFRDSPKVRARLEQVEASVLAGELPPAVAADQLLATFLG